MVDTMEIEKPSCRRWNHTEEFKQAGIAACCEAGASVAGIAFANELNANQVRRWMRERGMEPPSRSLPVGVVLFVGHDLEVQPDGAINRA